MQIDGFDWDQGNIDKCRKHGVSINEIESLFAGPTVILPDKQGSAREQRFRAIGTTPQRRPAFIVFTYRMTDDVVLIRPISARYMHKKEIESYEKAYPELQNR